MDFRAKITEAVDEITKDEQTQTLFKEDPVKAVEKVLGVDLPDDGVDRVIQGGESKAGRRKGRGCAGLPEKALLRSVRFIL